MNRTVEGPTAGELLAATPVALPALALLAGSGWIMYLLTDVGSIWEELGFWAFFASSLVAGALLGHCYEALGGTRRLSSALRVGWRVSVIWLFVSGLAEWAATGDALTTAVQFPLLLSVITILVSVGFGLGRVVKFRLPTDWISHRSIQYLQLLVGIAGIVVALVGRYQTEPQGIEAGAVDPKREYFDVAIGRTEVAEQANGYEAQPD